MLSLPLCWNLFCAWPSHLIDIMAHQGWNCEKILWLLSPFCSSDSLHPQNSIQMLFWPVCPQNISTVWDSAIINFFFFLSIRVTSLRVTFNEGRRSLSEHIRHQTRHRLVSVNMVCSFLTVLKPLTVSTNSSSSMNCWQQGQRRTCDSMLFWSQIVSASVHMVPHCDATAFVKHVEGPNWGLNQLFWRVSPFSFDKFILLRVNGYQIALLIQIKPGIVSSRCVSEKRLSVCFCRLSPSRCRGPRCRGPRPRRPPPPSSRPSAGWRCVSGDPGRGPLGHPEVGRRWRAGIWLLTPPSGRGVGGERNAAVVKRLYLFF